MAHFDVITEEKSILKERLLQSQRLVNLLCNTGDNVEEFIDYRTGSKSPAAALIKQHFYVPETTTKDKNFITMKGRVNYAASDVIKDVSLIVFIICNNDQIELMQGSRADLIADEVDKILNSERDRAFGLGGIKIGVADEVEFAPGFTGWQIPFSTNEFNRDVDTL